MNEREIAAKKHGMSVPEYVLTRAKSQVISSDPYFATLLMNMKFSPDKSEMAMSTDGETIYYNEEFVENTPIDEIKGVIVHEVVHCVLSHHTRMGNRNLPEWNDAADYVANPIVLKAGYSLPKGYLYDKQFDGLSVEEVYSKITSGKKKEDKKDGDKGQNKEKQKEKGQSQKDQKNNSGAEKEKKKGNEGDGKGQGGNDSGGTGNKSNAAAPSTTGTSGSVPWGSVKKFNPNANGQQNQEQQIKNEEERWKVLAKQAEKSSEKMGVDDTEGIQREISYLQESRASWKEVISKFVEELSRNDYTWSKPNPRYIYRGIILPSLESKSYSKILIGVDTSGSASKKDVQDMVSEVLGIIELYDEARSEIISLPVAYCDYVFRGYEELSIDSTPNPIGGGRTDFKPIFNWLKTDEGRELEVKAVIYLTDGYCDSFPEEPDIPVVWCLTKRNFKFNPPFGEVTNLFDL